MPAGDPLACKRRQGGPRIPPLEEGGLEQRGKK